VFDAGFVVQTPVAAHWGMNEATRVVAKECDSSDSAICDSDFRLFTCETDSDCVDAEGAVTGKCRILESTKTVAGAAGTLLCIGDNDVLVDTYYNMIIKAEHHVDITSLNSPDGRFMAAIRNAIRLLESEGRSVVVRMLFGNIPLGNEYAHHIVDSLLTHNGPSHGCFRTVDLHVGSYRIGTDSWNHGKIIAVDGEHLVYGGINFYSFDYLGKENVYDISIQGSGSMAQTGHGYANALWNTIVTETSRGLGEVSYSQCSAGAPAKEQKNAWKVGAWQTPPSAAAFPPCQPEAVVPDGVRAIPAARLGKAWMADGTRGKNPSDKAFVAMFAAATKSVKISSQDFGPIFGYLGWPEDYIDALNTAMLNGAHVYIVFSNPFGGPTLPETGTGAYGYGWTASDVVQRFRERADDNALTTLTDDMFCDRLHITYISAESGSQTWANTEVRVGNHGKFFAIDDKAFYVGSQNLYVCDLAEFGVIIDDEAKTKEVIENVWDKMWEQSVAISTSGSNSAKGGKCCWKRAVTADDGALPARGEKIPDRTHLYCDWEYKTGGFVPKRPSAF